MIKVSRIIIFSYCSDPLQGFSQLPESGGAGLQIALKVGGQEPEIQSKYKQFLPKISKSGEAVAPLVRNALVLNEIKE